jgi:ATP-dependent RNA helicase RhlB
MLFSATLNNWVKNLAWEYTKTPFEIAIEPETVTVDEVEQILYHVQSANKMKVLMGIMEKEKPESAIIFCNTKRYAEIVAKRLRVNGYECEFIMGDLPQVKRLKIIDDVKAGKVQFLVATDVAARGLDIEGLSLVVNYDLPIEAENYVHRIGRTARAGKTGKAISLSSEQDVYELPDIEKYIGKKIPSQIAGEDLFGQDKSEGLRIRTDFYDDRDGRRGGSSRPGGRSGRDSGRSSPGGSRSGRDSSRGSADGRWAERSGTGRSSPVGENRRGSGGERQYTGRPPQERNRTAGETRKAPAPGSSGRSEPRSRGGERNLSKLSLEERMAYYKEKYGEGENKASPRKESPGGDRSRGGGKRSGQRPQGQQPEHGGQQPEAAPAAQSAPAETAKKPGIFGAGLFGQLLGAFKKKD